jgi:hypothetical protein
MAYRGADCANVVRAACCSAEQLYLVTRFLEFIQPDLGRLSIGGILADIRTSMMDEVDFTKVRRTSCAPGHFISRKDGGVGRAGSCGGSLRGWWVGWCRGVQLRGPGRHPAP